MRYSILEKRVKKLEEAIDETEDISLIDDKLHNELIWWIVSALFDHVMINLFQPSAISMLIDH